MMNAQTGTARDGSIIRRERNGPAPLQAGTSLLKKFMHNPRMTSRREFLTSGLAAAAVCSHAAAETHDLPQPLQEFGYGDVELAAGPAQKQFQETQSLLMGLNENSLLKPWRLRAGLPAPGPDLGGWYDEVPLIKTESGGHGFAPAHCFGQWLSALARGYAVTHDLRTRAKLERLLDLYGAAISERFYANFRFPAYNYDKLVIGLIDAQRFAGIVRAFELLDRTTLAAEPIFRRVRSIAMNRSGAGGSPWGKTQAMIISGTSPTHSQRTCIWLAIGVLVSATGEWPVAFPLDETYFDPLAENENILANHHAYSFCNALSSAMQAFLADGSSSNICARPAMRST